MTDTYGSEPHDHEMEHDDALTHDGDAVHEAPPEYEFSDDNGSAIEQPEEDVIPSSEAGSPRRSPFLPIAAALGGVLLLGAVAWWQFGGVSSSPPPPVSRAASPILPVTPPPNGTPAPSLNVADASSGVAPKTSSTVTQDKDSVGAMALTSSGVTPSMPSGAAQQAKPTDASVAAPALTSSAPPAAFSLPAPTAPNDNADHRIEMLTVRIDNLQNALDQANQQLGQMTNVLAASSGIGASPTSPAKDLQDRIDKLEQKIATMNAVSSTPAAASPSSSISGIDVAPQPRKAAVVSVSRPKATHKTAHQHVKKAPVEDKAESNWVLRAASPGQAWVATSATSHDLKQVQVGDKLTGIGRVTAIQKQGDAWIVRGTKGSIQ